MKKDILNKLLIVVVLSVMFGCKAKKAIVTTPPPPPPTENTDNTKKDKLAAITAAQADFNTLSIKAKADLTIDNNNNNVSMNIRIKKGQIIWVSVTAIAGIEIARALITPDSVKILNRLENQYIKKPFSYIYEFTNDQINFGTLQAIFAGNALPEVLTESSELSAQGNQSRLSGMLGSLAYIIQLNERNKVLQTNLKDAAAGQTLSVNYGGFIPVGANEIPHTVNITSQAQSKNIQINLRYTRVGINETLQFPFTVPDRFTVKN